MANAIITKFSKVMHINRIAVQIKSGSLFNCLCSHIYGSLNSFIDLQSSCHMNVLKDISIEILNVRVLRAFRGLFTILLGSTVTFYIAIAYFLIFL